MNQQASADRTQRSSVVPVPELRFTAHHFPVSSAFVNFLDEVTGQKRIVREENDWGDQITERMGKGIGNIPEIRKVVQSASDTAFQTTLGRDLTLRAYNLLGHLLTGNTDFYGRMHSANRFILVVSAPRHGGSYLTKELFRAVGRDHRALPNYFAHDGFPEAHNAWIGNDGIETMPMTRRTIQQTAEWLTMADWFFRDAHPLAGLRTIPKKGTKMVYEGRFFRDLFGPLAEWVVAVRHPAAACLSLVEKAGGMTPDGKFPMQPRSVIERWVVESWESDGVNRQEVGRMPYFDAYLHYWLRYHQIMAVNGILQGNRRLTVLPYHRSAFEAYISAQHARFASGRSTEPFFVHGTVREKYPEWIVRSANAIEDVAQWWNSFGVAFPIAEVSEAL